MTTAQSNEKMEENDNPRVKSAPKFKKTITLAKEKAKENYEEEVIHWARVTQDQVRQCFTRFQNKALQLATKHAQTVKEIQEEIENDKRKFKGTA